MEEETHHPGTEKDTTMTAPRQPRHRLADDHLVPAPAEPVDPPTQALPVIPSQRAAVPQVFPATPAPTGFTGPGPSGPTPSWPAPPAAAAPQAPAGQRRRLKPRALAGVTALVLVLGVGVVIVESGAPAAAAPISGE